MRVWIFVLALVTVMFGLIGVRYVTARADDQSIYACVSWRNEFTGVPTLMDIYSGEQVTDRRWKYYDASLNNYEYSSSIDASPDGQWSLMRLSFGTFDSVEFRLAHRNTFARTGRSYLLMRSTNVISVAWSLDSRRFAFTYELNDESLDGVLAVGELGDPNNPSPTILKHVSLGYNAAMRENDLVWTRDMTKVVVARYVKGSDGLQPQLDVWDSKTLNLVTTLATGYTSKLTLSLDSRYLAYLVDDSEGVDRTLRLAVSDLDSMTTRMTEERSWVDGHVIHWLQDSRHLLVNLFGMPKEQGGSIQTNKLGNLEMYDVTDPQLTAVDLHADSSGIIGAWDTTGYKFTYASKLGLDAPKLMQFDVNSGQVATLMQAASLERMESMLGTTVHRVWTALVAESDGSYRLMLGDPNETEPIELLSNIRLFNPAELYVELSFDGNYIQVMWENSANKYHVLIYNRQTKTSVRIDHLPWIHRYYRHTFGKLPGQPKGYTFVVGSPANMIERLALFRINLDTGETEQMTDLFDQIRTSQGDSHTLPTLPYLPEDDPVLITLYTAGIPEYVSVDIVIGEMLPPVIPDYRMLQVDPKADDPNYTRYEFSWHYPRNVDRRQPNVELFLLERLWLNNSTMKYERWMEVYSNSKHTQTIVLPLNAEIYYPGGYGNGGPTWSPDRKYFAFRTIPDPNPGKITNIIVDRHGKRIDAVIGHAQGEIDYKFQYCR